jgi:hypothetical protein
VAVYKDVKSRILALYDNEQACGHPLESSRD